MINTFPSLYPYSLSLSLSLSLSDSPNALTILGILHEILLEISLILSRTLFNSPEDILWPS